MSDVEDHVSDGGGDDLFGDDGSDASLIADNPPLPSDDELASEPDRHRSQRSETREAAGGDGYGERREKTVAEEIIYRHGLPKTNDGNVSCPAPGPPPPVLSVSDQYADASGESPEFPAILAH